MRNRLLANGLPCVICSGLGTAPGGGPCPVCAPPPWEGKPGGAAGQRSFSNGGGPPMGSDQDMMQLSGWAIRPAHWWLY